MSYESGFKPPAGRVPSIMLCNPKNAYNVSMTQRIASCYGWQQVWYTGDRVSLDLAGKKRLPREERMKGFKQVEIIQYDRPLDQFGRDVVPVAVEVRANSEKLHHFEHPDNAVYVFGPEDGSIPEGVLTHCHRFLVIPVRFCLNLATAVSTILWDRALKRGEVHEMEDAKAYAETDTKAMGIYDELRQS